MAVDAKTDSVDDVFSTFHQAALASHHGGICRSGADTIGAEHAGSASGEEYEAISYVHGKKWPKEYLKGFARTLGEGRGMACWS